MSQAVGIQAACPAGSSCSPRCALGDGVAAPAMLTAALGKSSQPSAPFTGSTLGHFCKKADAELFFFFLFSLNCVERIDFNAWKSKFCY